MSLYTLEYEDDNSRFSAPGFSQDNFRFKKMLCST